MILFIAPNPYKQKHQDGFFLRVAAIDRVFKNQKKIYYDDLKTTEQKVDALVGAGVIYIHSIYQAERIIDLVGYFPGKVILDLHGLVPEEEKLMSNTRRSVELTEVERLAFSLLSNFVSVTESMAQYYREKYKLKNKQFIVLPIFQDVPQRVLSSKKLSNKVIYSGGAQKWQNTELMIKTIKSKSSYEYTILTQEPTAFSSIDSRKYSNIIIRSVAPDKVQDYYKEATFGFILRDDSIINKVACPTKLVEYLESGVIPIVMNPDIGDFNSYNYRYITVDQLGGNKTDSETLQKIINANYDVVARIKKLFVKNKITLIRFYEDKMHEIEPVNIELKSILGLTYKVMELKLEAEHYKGRIAGLENALEVTESELFSVRNSKVWKLAERIRKLRSY